MDLLKRLFLFSLIFIIYSCNNSEKSDSGNYKPGNSKGSAVDSVETFSDQIVADPNNPNLYLKRAAVYENKQLYNLAEDDLKRALSIDSTSSFMQEALGDLYFKTGNLKDARLRYARSADLDETNTDAMLKLAESFLRLGRHKESMENINRALRVDEQLYRGYFLKGFIYQEVGDTTLAKSSFQTSIELNPDFYQGFMSLGYLYASEGNELAVNYFNTALQIDPGSTEAMYNKGMFYQNNGKYEEAMDVYREMIDNNPGEFLGYYNTGYILLTETGEYQNAQAYFDTVLTLVPNYPDALYNKGLCFEEMGETENAIQTYRKVLQVEPEHDLAVRGLDRLIR